MKIIDVVGGVYGEKCAFPDWNEYFGSAGRAAIGISEYVDQVRLHTIIEPTHARTVRTKFESFGVDLAAQAGTQMIGFDYLHTLSRPEIFPHPLSITQEPSFTVEADTAIYFGMMECTPKVIAETCVYDPQSAADPKRFRETGSAAKRLAVVANARELELMTGKTGDAGAKELLEAEDAEVVIVKKGMHGAGVYERSGSIGSVSAYKSDSVFSVGSGDVFVSAFGLAWALEGYSPVDAARYASKAVAGYVETCSLPFSSIHNSVESHRDPIIPTSKSIYLAGPFRELGQRAIVNEAREFFLANDQEVFSPVHDIGHGPANEVVRRDLEALDASDAVFAILNGSSPGTLFEVGYAVNAGKPVVCVAQNMKENDMKLPVGSGCLVHTDFVSALHQMVWHK